MLYPVTLKLILITLAISSVAIAVPNSAEVGSKKWNSTEAFRLALFITTLLIFVVAIGLYLLEKLILM